MPDVDSATRIPADSERTNSEHADSERADSEHAESPVPSTGASPVLEEDGKVDLQSGRSLTGSEPAPSAPRRRRHGIQDEVDDPPAEPQARSQARDDDDEAPLGRHGGHAGGLTAAALIERAQRSADLPAGGVSPVGVSTQNGVEGLRVEREIGVLPSALHAVEELLEPEPLSLDPEVIAGKSRAGRNVPAAIAVGVLLGCVVALSLFAYRPSFVVLIMIAVAIGSYEMGTAIATVEARAPVVPIVVGGAAMVFAAWQRGPDGLVGALLLTTLGIVIWRVADGAAGYRQDVAAGTLIALYVPFLAGFAALLAHPPDGAARVILFVVTVACSDTGGFATGVVFGKHPMAPMVSPKKSWEGFAGSLLGAGLAGSLIMDLSFHHLWWKGAVFGLVIAVLATLGDLGESMIKRDLGLKDMGKLLPGHGGMMDRLDSLLPCAPAAYLLLALILPN